MLWTVVTIVEEVKLKEANQIIKNPSKRESDIYVYSPNFTTSTFI